ncbi:tRNA modification GTPase TrmE [Spiroplasma alleghenense]|uniref:tRNA modification GTPase MnmE n=2 Tax=Spiroplasma alleghenense TaxID=216931 RepID=A0A345Z5D9_9MOLU|nr:tRNA uridine-5-carboxymethylaminomethyl(34) synthesis GTPase MnmE [Spiroplasma alleghenense]AXK51818.1 tRNA modification GTPase TrmE [Spiroplasma alleghenense]
MILDTIVAPATNIAQQALAIIRLSGPDSFSIINKLIKKPIEKNRQVNFRHLYLKGKIIDQVVVTSFVSPNSFTGEDVVEINCHGGVLVTNQVIQALINSGARMALPGEFSQRAFLNDKINLIQAEAINDLITAKNQFASDLAIRNMSSKKNPGINKMKEILLDVISRIQTSIDYPEYDDIEGSSNDELIRELEKLIKITEDAIFKSNLASKSVTGIKTAIIGETNVGKSSILNCLLNEEKAIVSNVAGTTRDLVEGEISFENITLRLIDTAGIRETNDDIESAGIRKSYQTLKEADLIIHVFDSSSKNYLVEDKLLELMNSKTVITVFNKSELISNEQKKAIIKRYPEAVFCSAQNNEIDELLNKIKKQYDFGNILQSDDLIISNINQISLLKNIENKLKIAYNNFKSGFTVDMINFDLYEAWNELNNLLGESYEEEIIDNIFRKYCLGK